MQVIQYSNTYHIQSYVFTFFKFLSLFKAFLQILITPGNSDNSVTQLKAPKSVTEFTDNQTHTSFYRQHSNLGMTAN
jgi:hypothetical protein